MENRDPMRKCASCDNGDGARYLGDRDQIENLLGFCSMTEVRKLTRAQISLQPPQQIDSVLEETK
jgi:hypothetical protein